MEIPCVHVSTHQLGFLIGGELKQYRQLEEDLGDIQARKFLEIACVVFLLTSLGLCLGESCNSIENSKEL